MRPQSYQELLSYSQLPQGAAHSADRPKVAFVLPTLMAGGAERVLITLMNGLDRGRFAPEFIVMNEKGALRDWIAADIPFHSLGNRKISRGLPHLLAKLNEIQPDIIVSTMAAMNFGVLLVKPFLKRKARIVIREAVIPSSIIESQRFPSIVKTAYRTLYPQADLILSPARCIIDEFDSYLGMGTDNHALLHNPVHIERIQCDKPASHAIDEKRRSTVKFICAGRLHKQKGFDWLIDALPRLRTPFDWELSILGTGAEKDTLQAQIERLGLTAKVKLEGLIKAPWPHIAAADAFLLPSRWEGLPNVVLESLSVGTPVIGTRSAGGIQEIAALALPGAVEMADDVDTFLNAMARVRPRPAHNAKPSLLPEYFHLENIMERFTDLLTAQDVPMLAPAMPKRAKAASAHERASFGRRRAAA